MIIKHIGKYNKNDQIIRITVPSSVFCGITEDFTQ